MTNLFIALGLSLAQFVCGSVAVAQDVIPTEPALFQSFGGKPGLVKLVDTLWEGLMADPRMQPHFKDASPKRVKSKLVEQFCQVLGGGCAYTGDDMKTVHMGLVISKADFNALVEDLQNAMDANGIAFRDQNQLLARLAPMYRDNITK